MPVMPTFIVWVSTQKGTTHRQRQQVTILLIRLNATEVHVGDCIGADEEIAQLAWQEDCQVVGHPPDNPSKRAFLDYDEERPVAPYLVRNRHIVNETGALIATPAEQVGEELRSGTWATVRHARKMGKPIYVVRPDGTVEKENV